MKSQYNPLNQLSLSKLLLITTLILSVYTARSYAQDQGVTKVSDNRQLLEALGDPAIDRIELESGYYEAFKEHMRQGTKVFKSNDAGRSTDCVYWISPSNLCFDTDTVWQWNTASAGTLDQFLCGCCPEENGGFWELSPGYAQPGNVVFIDPIEMYEMDFKVDAPGQYLLRYVWPAPFNTFVETIYTFSETYFASISANGGCALSTMVHFEYGSIAPEESVTLDWTLNGSPYAGPAVDPMGDTLDFFLTVPVCGEYTLEATLTPEFCEPIVVSATVMLWGDGNPIISGVGADTTIICPDVAQFSIPTASDPCGQGVIMNHKTDTIPGDCPDHYTIIRTWIATNECGNSDTATQTIVHLPNPNPEIILGPLDVIQGDTIFAGCEETVTIPFPEIETPCGPATVLYSRSDGGLWADPFPEGETEVCYWGISPCGYSTDTLCFYVIVDPCDQEQLQHCTMTQGYYGNPGGLYCDGRSTGELIEDLLAAGDLVVGSNGNTLTFISGDSDCIIGLLPGGGPPKSIQGENNCGNLSGIKLKKGKIHNVLLAQAITLGLNLRLDDQLGGLDIVSDTLLTAPSSGCGEEGDTVAGPYTKYAIPLSVYNELSDNGNIVPTVADLFALANIGLGGGDVGETSLGDIANALGVINDSFDECAFGYFQLYLQSVAASEPGSVKDATAIDMNIYPNPFSQSANIEFTARDDGQAVVEIYSITGAKVATLFDGRVETGNTYTFTFSGTQTVKQVTYICVIRTGSETQIKRMVMMR